MSGPRCCPPDERLVTGCLKTARRVRYLAVPPERTGDLHARYALFLTSLPSQDKLVWGDVELLGWRGI